MTNFPTRTRWREEEIFHEYFLGARDRALHEAKIDSLPQSWACLSGAAKSDRAALALESAWKYLVHEDEGLWSVVGGAFSAPSKDLWDTRSGRVPWVRHDPSAGRGDRGHPCALGPRRVPGSRIVGPLSVSRCA